ncbi:hypothetical protein DAI22_08g112801 [Oryza sativa Japonica Group]|uniref:Uncharacterized protein n=1 Tax=Oryza rufipogon TaxID=4529 RepID=A0A0E0QHB3_ORYRU|nr:hypothetical protein DAI22_08g112801 [Oryza sativa Japonica Group]
MRWEIDRAINRIPLLRFLPPQWQLRLRLSSTSGFPQSPFDPLTLASPRLGESDSEHSQPDRSEFHGLNHSSTSGFPQNPFDSLNLASANRIPSTHNRIGASSMA